MKPSAAPVPARALVLDADAFQHHVDYFNGMVEEGVVNHIPNAEAWAWMKQNIPSHPRLGVCADSRSSGQIVC